MCKTLRANSLLLMWFVLNSVLLTNAFETYSETDQLAEESIGGYDKEGHQEMTTNTNLISLIKDSKVGDQSNKSSSEEDDLIDPLQKILPKVKFNCKGKSEGYYADTDFCEVFHYCKTNGFRFTFMCPPESYYNNKLMACEFNSTLSKCVNREKHNKILNKGMNTIKENSIKTSDRQTIEVLQKSSSQINTDTEKSESVTTTTVEPIKVVDPYLTRRRTNYGLYRSKSKTMSNKTKSENITQSFSQEMRSQNQTQNETKENFTQTILPFTGFRKFNRNNTQMKIKDNTSVTNNNKIINSTNGWTNSSDHSVRIPSNALPVLKSIRPQLLNNSNQLKNYRNIKSWTKTATTTATTTPTTTPYPSLLGPTGGVSTTVSPFDYFTPLFNSDPNLELNSGFFPLSMHKKPENAEKDKSKQRKSLMTQNFFNSIRHTTRRPNFEKESQIEETLKQSETNSEFSSYSPPSEGLTHLNGYNRSPLFNSGEEDQLSSDSHLSESQIHELIEKLKQWESHQQLDPSFQKSDYSGAESSVEPNESMEDMNESDHIGRRKRRDKNKSKQFLTVPLLVPTGVSKSDLRRKLSSTLLKPTVLSLTENGDQMPAYVLQFQNSDRPKKVKNNKQRSKRQTFGWNSFNSNPFVRNTYYMPMNSMPSMSSMSSMSLPIHSNFNNHIGPTLPMNTFRSRHMEIGERHGFGLPSAQQHIPYYIPPKQPFIPNNFIGHNYYKDNSIYDLSEFSDFYENPFNDRPVIPIGANDMSPYRSVSLRRPGFKRPPRREKVPEFKYTKTVNNETKTTVRPFNSVPVSPRPYSQPIVKQQFYAQNSNPFSDLSDESISEAIRAFDSSEDNLQPIDSDFVSQPLFPFNSPQSFSNDFIPITPKTHHFADTLNGRSSRISKFSELPLNNYVSDNFLPIPNFGDPEYRLPFIDIPDPTLTNLGHRSNPERGSNKEFVHRKHENISRYSTPYSPEILFNTNTENQNLNETERNPNHNYDNVSKEELKTAPTVDNKHNLRPILKSSLNWDNIVGQYHKQNVSVTNVPQISVNKNDSNEQKESEIWKNARYVSYGTRLSANTNKYSQNPEISVKTSVSSVSSLQPEASNQIVISTKLGTSALSSQPINDNKEKSIDELYNQRAFDRLMLFNYYNHLNSQKTSTTTTTTVSPLEGKYPSTSHWSIRGWTGQYYPHSSKTPTATTSPIVTTHSNIEYLDLFESEANLSEMTTELSETTTTDNSEPPYKRILNSQKGATFHSNKYSKPHSFAENMRSDISDYLNSFTSTQQTLQTI